LGLAEHAFVGLVDLDEVTDGKQGHGKNIKQEELWQDAIAADLRRRAALTLYKSAGAFFSGVCLTRLGK
jgi:hypothetical protein